MGIDSQSGRVLTHYVVHMKLIQCWKSVISQFKKKKTNSKSINDFTGGGGKPIRLILIIPLYKFNERY